MNTYPWGPHGPQSSPHQVTPNPTPAYVPPPAAPSYSNPVSYGGGGGYSGGGTGTYTGGGGVGYGGPVRRSYAIAFVLAAIFGPFGLLYSNAKPAKLLLLLVAANTAWNVLTTSSTVIERAGGYLSFIGDSASMASLWSLVTFLSVILSIVGVRASRQNKDDEAK
jgi:hypothetical protein